jgi:hypothetical protein
MNKFEEIDGDTDIEIVSHALMEAKKHGLESEVMTWSLKTLKDNPSLSIEHAVKIGLAEWIK